jgi:cation transport regulator
MTQAISSQKLINYENKDLMRNLKRGHILPYKNEKDLPASVQKNLPEHAKKIYLEAFNNAWDEYKNPEDRIGDASREETAHKVAWSAVKKSYEKNEKSGVWKEKAELQGGHHPARRAGAGSPPSRR